MEKVFHNNKCVNCGGNFEVTDRDLEFYEKIKVPEPTWCPDCRQQRRLAWRNQRSLYRRKCDATGKELISIFSPDKKVPVYANAHWYSDKWDAKDFGRDFDFSRPFFEQFAELMEKVPQMSLASINNINSDFVNQCGWCQDCYLIFEADANEKCMYSQNIYNSLQCLDVVNAEECKYCYECVTCYNCYNLRFSVNANTCSDSWFLKNCIGCMNCFGCVNLRNKQYYYLNEKCSKDEYEKKLAALDLWTVKGLKSLQKSFIEFVKKLPHKYIHGANNENSTGDYLWNTKRCQECFEVTKAEDCKYTVNSRNVKNVYDMTVFGGNKGADFCYEVCGVGEAVRNIFFSSDVCNSAYDVYYCMMCINNSHDLFGCIGLKHGSYCILNKQYSREEYEELFPRIVEHMKKTGEWGQFFPISMSLFAYNETTAQDYFPLAREMAISKGYKWKDADPKDYLPASVEVADKIDNVSDNVVNELLACDQCKKNYRISRQELAFYRKLKLPIPLSCFDCRLKGRMALCNPRKLYVRECKGCAKIIKTTFAPQRPENIYCEECYLRIVK